MRTTGGVAKLGVAATMAFGLATGTNVFTVMGLAQGVIDAVFGIYMLADARGPPKSKGN